MYRKIIGGGLAVIAVVALAGFGFWQHHQQGFNAIANNPHQMTKLIKQAQDREQPTTVVLVRSTCRKCEAAKPAIVKGVQETRQAHQNVLVFDGDHLTKAQLKELAQAVPSLISRDGQMHTPTVTTVRPAGPKGHRVLLSTKTLVWGSKAQLKQFFDGVTHHG